MQLVCLNVWQGREFHALIQFIKELSKETDFFCFQEVLRAEHIQRENPDFHLNLYSELSTLLPEFCSSFAPMLSGNDFANGFASDVLAGNVIFSKKHLNVIEEGSFYLFGSLSELYMGNPHKVGFLQYKKLHIANKILTVANVHGIARWPKIDTPERFEQLKNIKKFLSNVDAPVILCGDFNLFPHTESVRALSENMKNLTEEFSIMTTRSAISRGMFNADAEKDTISDYVFVSPDIEIQSFLVPEMEISDHLPLIAKFSI